jgi:site-specific recombinase XerD
VWRLWRILHNRHTYASALIHGGESVKTVQARLGHKTAVETLNVYAHLWPDSEDRTRAAVDAMFGDDFGAALDQAAASR